jgi:hypothetical protein
MPDAQIITLADGPSWAAMKDATPVESTARRSSCVIVMSPRRWRRAEPPTEHVEMLSSHVAAACADADEAAVAGDAYERLAAMALARKLADESPIRQGERQRMLRDAGLPGVFYANPATEAIFAASAEHLGKGGVFGSISNAVSSAVKAVGKAAEVVLPVPYIATKLTQAVAKNGPGLINGLVAKGEQIISKTATALPAVAGNVAAGAISNGINSVAGNAASELGAMTGTGGPQYVTPQDLGSTTSPLASYMPFLVVGAGIFLLVNLSSGRRRR